MAVERVERLLRAATAAIGACNVGYAVIGGNAVAAWVASVDDGAVRATKDVDVLIHRRGLGTVEHALRDIGLDYAEVLGVSMFFDREHASPKTGLQIVFAGERVRPEYRHAAPDTSEVVARPLGYAVLALRPLVEMKLQANRLIDQVHIQDMNGIGLITPELSSALPPDLRERLHAILSRPS